MAAMPQATPPTWIVNGRSYKTPLQPTVVVCVDGCEPDYLTQAVSAGHMPWLQSVLVRGTALRAQSAMPSFTNPNNVSIITGVPPSVHGISGNFFLDPATGQEVMMNEPQWLRCPTVLAEASAQGLDVVAITAKDKLRRLLAAGLRGACFSAERPEEATMETHGIDGVVDLVGRPIASVYSADLSEYVLAAGVRIMQERRPDIMYLSTTDYVQHKNAPGTRQANTFYAMLDGYMAELESLGCVVVITADHGMQPKAAMDASPQVVYLQDRLQALLMRDDCKVVLPITDPYVAHHGALGSYATVHLPDDVASEPVCAALSKLPGIEAVFTRDEAARVLELPADRIGDLVVLGDRSTAIGTTRTGHDVSGLDAPLRSHGGWGEQWVPLICNLPCPDREADRIWRNFDAFDLALNYAQ